MVEAEKRFTKQNISENEILSDLWTRIFWLGKLPFSYVFYGDVIYAFNAFHATVFFLKISEKREVFQCLEDV